MNDVTTQPVRLAVRASDAEREQTVTLLQRSFADGRLTQAELEERAGAAYQARTTAQLRDLTADLPAAEQPPRPGMVLDRRLLCILLCVHPPAGLVYWLLSLICPAKPAAATTAPSAEKTDLRTATQKTGVTISRPEPAIGAPVGAFVGRSAHAS
jgi:hypothetical protein